MRLRRIRGLRLKIKLPKIFKWRRRNWKLRFSNLFARIGYARMDRVGSGPAVAPKGYLAVYVGGSENETERHLVPVVYFNHPMFGKLLEAAERIYGFDYPGRIVIPCEVSEFEEVKKRIAAAEHGRRRHRYPCRRW